MPLYTPKGFHIAAQGQRSATLGDENTKTRTLKGLNKGRNDLMEGSIHPLYAVGVDSSIVNRPVRCRIPYVTLSGYGFFLVLFYPGWRFADPGL